DVLEALTPPGTRVLLVGVAGNTMLRALGGSVGRSSIEEDYLAGARTLADKLGPRLLLPIDLMVAQSARADEGVARHASELRADEMALDLGPQSLKQLEMLVDQSSTIIWCGTAGFHKSPAFARGTRVLCETLANSSAFTMVAGDDSVAAAHALGS